MSPALLPYKAQLIESALCVGAFILLKALSHRLVRSTVLRSASKSGEGRDVQRFILLLLVMVLGIVLAGIWGMEQSELVVFATSVVTVLGVAFFAEMSVLSNITACMVLFFQHPIKVGDRVSVHDGQREWEGELEDITYFFTFIRTDDGTQVSIPNAVMLKGSFAIIRGIT